MSEPSEPRIVVYCTSWCSWCTRAKELLARHGLAFREVDAELEWGAGFRDEIEARTGGRTVPQIVIDGRPIGGYDELALLDRAGGLAPLG